MKLAASDCQGHTECQVQLLAHWSFECEGGDNKESYASDGKEHSPCFSLSVCHAKAHRPTDHTCMGIWANTSVSPSRGPTFVNTQLHLFASVH